MGIERGMGGRNEGRCAEARKSGRKNRRREEKERSVTWHSGNIKIISYTNLLSVKKEN